MRLQQPPRLIRVLPLLSILPFFVGSAQALTQKYCSSQNTGTANSQGTSVYQTTGLCHDACVDQYAFAVVQGNSCWCSNYVPADQSDTGDCDETCPGYPSENCGSTDNSLYGYIALSKSPSGTAGASSSATSTSTHKTSTSSTASPSSSAQATTVTADAKTIYQTVTESAEVITTQAIPKQSSKTSATTHHTTTSPSKTSTSDSSAAESTSSKSATPVTQVTLVTVGGSVVTQTVTSTPEIDGSEKKSKGISGGAIAGAVVGSILGLAALLGLVFLLLRRRQKEKQAQDAEANDENGPRRNVSTMSKTGLLRTGEKDHGANLPAVNTRNSSHFGTEWSDTMTPNSERRNSRPVFHDQRLNPTPFGMENGSRSSIISLDDNQDYTRTLNVRNPDPPDRTSFDARSSWGN